MKPTTSIIVVVKNDPGIEPTLDLIYRQETKVRFETIVIDSSDPERLADVRKKFPQARWEQFDQKGKRVTISEQRNRGLELARGEIIVFIDASCKPSPNWLSALVDAINDGEDIVCGPCHASNKNNLVHYAQDRPKRTYVNECPTMNVAMRKEVAERVGAFDIRIPYGA